LKHKTFSWTKEVEENCLSLNHAMCSAPILALPDFAATFEIETDASDKGVGAVLSQQGHPVAFFSKALSIIIKNYLLMKKSSYQYSW
jgi:hypothetical protein